MNIGKTLKTFIGKTEQLPPMFSAVKVDGIRLYKHARKGLTVARKKRQIIVHNIFVIYVSTFIFDFNFIHF